MNTRSLLTTLLSLPLNGCLEPPTIALEDERPPPDLGSVDTWGPIDEVPLEPDPTIGPDDGASTDGPDSGTGEGPSPDGVALPDPALAQLRIHEVLVDPPGKDGALDGPEWIEIHNPGPEPVELGGLTIRSLSWPLLNADELGLADVTLAADGLLVVRRWTSDAGPLPAAVIGPELIEVGFAHSSGLRNDDGAIALGSAEGTFDLLVYGAPQAAPFDDPAHWSGAPAPSPGVAQSLCRVDMGDHDDSTDWSICSPSPGIVDPDPPEGGDDEAGTGDSDADTDSDGGSEGDDPEPESEPIAPGAISVVEVLANPLGSSSQEKYWEFIELINISENQVELSGCRIFDDTSPDAPGSDPLIHRSGDGGCLSITCLAPGRRVLIVGNQWMGDAGDALVLETDDSTIADGGLTNTEAVVLRDAYGSAITTYRAWPDPAGDPIPGDGQSLHRVDPALDDEPANWEAADPSPGT